MLCWAVALFLVSLSSCASPDAADLKTAFEKELFIIIEKHPAYSWGGCESEEKGLDCSGYLFLAAKRAGIPVKRTMAQNMYYGQAGWDAIHIKDRLGDADKCDLAWWTWKTKDGTAKPHRPYGHVGIFLEGKSGLLEVSHASGSKGVIIQPLKGTLITDMVGVKRMRALK